jgi:tRNA (guanine37-N1)-methyltransferase
MRFDIITVLPDLLESPFAHSILQRAQKKGLAEIHVHNLRDYSNNKQKSVDDYQYGGGSGMVMSIEPFANCIEKLRSERDYDEIIFMTPDGETLNQSMANELSDKNNVCWVVAKHGYFVAGRCHTQQNTNGYWYRFGVSSFLSQCE